VRLGRPGKEQYKMMRFVVRHAWLVVVAALGSLALVASASASPTAAVSVYGQGQTPEFVCPDTSTTFAGINFGATKVGGKLTWQGESGFNIGGDSVNKFGQFTSGTINKNSYSLNGILYEGSCNDVFNEAPATVTISGQCGFNVLIHYRDSNGEYGDFLGDVQCQSFRISGGA
jgi:hypothetical protein